MKAILKLFRILSSRLTQQGLRTTAIWAYARGIPYITGMPILKYSKITPQIYVGPQYRRLGKKLLENSGFEYSVNLRIEFDDSEAGLELRHYCYLPTIDDDAPSLEHLEKGVQFIENALSNGGKIYIHCAAGVGRAPTLVAALLISHGASISSSLAKIERTRPFINIMPEQMRQLKIWANSVENGKI